MKDRIKAFLASIIIIVYITASFAVYADGSILGSEQMYDGTIEIAAGTYYHQNVFYSDQSGVGKQSEYYIEYTPGSSVMPVISNGAAVYGRYDINQAYNSLKSAGYYPVGGINADFYSFQTGVPLSHCISDGKIISKDSSPQDAVGFMPDGTAFTGYLAMYTTVNKDGQSVLVENVNKYRQPYAVYLFTDDFGSETYDTAPGLVVVLSDISDSMKIQGEITATVESVDHYQGSVALPKGKYVISINDNLKEQDNYKFFESLAIGDKVTVRTSFEGDPRFADAVTVMGGSQGKLLNNGEVNTNLPTGAAPRTAVGVRADGSSIFYTIDGRQKNHSYGVQNTTLAKRLKELGCTDAILLDGGGSTTCGVIMPGDSDFKVVNSPSDGAVRKNSNFFFLVNKEKPTGSASKLFIYPLDMKLLSGAKGSTTISATDENFYPAAVPDVTYSVSSGTANADGSFIAEGDGKFTVSAQGANASGSVTYTVYKTPTAITVKTPSGKAESITLNPGEQVQLTANAWYKNSLLVSQNSCYSWSVNGDIGTITADGLFTANDTPQKKGEIVITAGDTQKKIPVTIKGNTDAPEYFHKIENFAYNDGKISMCITNEKGISVNKDGISLKIDGKPTAFEFSDGVISCDFEQDGKTHRISVSARNELENTTAAYFEIKGDSGKNVFSDTADSWAKDIITYMNSRGVINGYFENGSQVFRPGDNMTRAQFAVMIANYTGVNLSDYTSVSLPFNDAAQISDWAISQIKAMYKLGIIAGRQSDDGVYFDSNALLTRAEAAAIISRIMPEGLQKANLAFSDAAQIPDWAKDGMAVLTGVGALGGYSDNTVLPQKNITRAECAKLLYSVY